MKPIRLFLILGIFFSQHTMMNGQTSSLQFLYQSTIGRLVRPLLTNRWANKLIGWYADCRLSRIHISSFIRYYHINFEEAAQQNLDKYRSFNDFFCRKLRPSARPIDTDPLSIISPSDGELHIIENINPQTVFLVKNIPLKLEQFLQDQQLADYFYEGTIVVIYLAPQHYHRFHFPVDCTPEPARPVSGLFESVHETVYEAGIQPLLKNERQICLLHAIQGLIALIPVGALFVGRICQSYKPNQSYQKGDEAGLFGFGGSTVVLLFKKNFCHIDPIILEKTKNNQKTEIRMGERIATRITHV